MSNEERAQALAQYQAVLGYLQYENSAYWTRSGFISVAQSALLGFYANLFVGPTTNDCQKRVILAVISFVGLLLAFTWGSVTSKGDWWIRRWTDVLLQLEEKAFGKETEVFRGVYKRAAAGGPTNSNVVRTHVGYGESGLRWLPVIAGWVFVLVWVLGLLILFLV